MRQQSCQAGYMLLPERCLVPQNLWAIEISRERLVEAMLAHAGKEDYPRGLATGLSPLRLQCSDAVEAHRRGKPRNLIHFLQRSVGLDGKDTHRSGHRVERVEELAIAAGRDVKVRGVLRVGGDDRGRVERGQCAVLANRKSGDVRSTGIRCIDKS